MPETSPSKESKNRIGIVRTSGRLAGIGYFGRAENVRQRVDWLVSRFGLYPSPGLNRTGFRICREAFLESTTARLANREQRLGRGFSGFFLTEGPTGRILNLFVHRHGRLTRVRSVRLGEPPAASIDETGAGNLCGMETG
jgi:hypothetical protein